MALLPVDMKSNFDSHALYIIRNDDEQRLHTLTHRTHSINLPFPPHKYRLRNIFPYGICTMCNISDWTCICWLFGCMEITSNIRNVGSVKESVTGGCSIFQSQRVYQPLLNRWAKREKRAKNVHIVIDITQCKKLNHILLNWICSIKNVRVIFGNSGAKQKIHLTNSIYCNFPNRKRQWA